MSKPLVTFLAAASLAGAAMAAEVPRPSPEFAIQMLPQGQTLVTNYKGKVVLVAFMSTTCPHCQKLTHFLSSLQGEYGPRGLQLLGAVFNPMAHMFVGDFIKTYRPNFPLGWSTREAVHEYLQFSPMMQLYVPSLVFIDRKGVIRRQHTGEDPFFQNQNQNIRDAIEALLKDPVPPAVSKKNGSSAKKKSS